MTLPHSPDDLDTFSLAEVTELADYVVEEIVSVEAHISGWRKLKHLVPHAEWIDTLRSYKKFRRELFQLRDEDLPAARLRIAKTRETV